MSDHDEQVSRRYRELTRDQPPAAIDAAIRARSRLAVSRARASWVRPISIAAVLVMALGITLRMQQEQPGIESASPPAARVEAPRIDAMPDRPQPQSQAAPSAKPSAVPAPEKRIAAPPAPASAAPNPFAADIAPSAPATVPAQAAPPPPTANARDSRAERSNLAAPATQKRAAGAAAEAIESEPDAQLQRIAAMREAGKTSEADEALARFRERWPDYRIPDALWQRVKPR